MRSILHDWPDDECIQILKTLRTAARPVTQLILKGIVVNYACAELPPSSIPGNEVPTPPTPLLPNGGHANAFDYLIDMHVRLFHHLLHILASSPYYYYHLDDGLDERSGADA